MGHLAGFEYIRLFFIYIWLKAARVTRASGMVSVMALGKSGSISSPGLHA